MNLTVKLLKVVGSPFISEQEPPENYEEIFELYKHAVKNKIGLLYLEVLKNFGMLKFNLKSEYKRIRRQHEEQVVTLRRVSNIFNLYNVKYVVFKSIMPFPAVPNDIDVLHMGSYEEYENAIKIMLQSGYMEVRAPVGSLQHMFHDIRMCEHTDPREKDVYDIDLYHKAAASYIVYLDKRKIKEYIMEMNISGDKIKILKPEAELIAIIVHSIIPEQIFTLFTYYATLYYLKKLNSKEISGLINLAKENNVIFPVRAHFSLVAELHQAAHAFVPEKVEAVLESVGDELNERKNLRRNDFKTPHKYCWLTLIRTLLEKRKDEEFRRSFVRQIVSMLKPDLTKWVISNIIWRRKRETY